MKLFQFFSTVIWKGWLDMGTELAGDFKKLCKAKGIQFFSTMGETKAGFADYSKRSLKNVLYPYMEEYVSSKSVS